MVCWEKLSTGIFHLEKAVFVDLSCKPHPQWIPEGALKLLFLRGSLDNCFIGPELLCLHYCCLPCSSSLCPGWEVLWLGNSAHLAKYTVSPLMTRCACFPCIFRGCLLAGPWHILCIWVSTGSSFSSEVLSFWSSSPQNISRYKVDYQTNRYRCKN